MVLQDSSNLDCSRHSQGRSVAKTGYKVPSASVCVEQRLLDHAVERPRSACPPMYGASQNHALSGGSVQWDLGMLGCITAENGSSTGRQGRLGPQEWRGGETVADEFSRWTEQHDSLVLLVIVHTRPVVSCRRGTGVLRRNLCYCRRYREVPVTRPGHGWRFPNLATKRAADCSIDAPARSRDARTRNARA